MSEFIPNNLPLDIDIETKAILKKSILANKALAKLNGVAKIIPNQAILINSLILQEAKDSSEIENIITTHDELYQSSLDISNISHATKEVQNYSRALLKGFDLVKDNSLLLTRHIVDIQQELEGNVAGIRKQSGTVLKNQATGEVIHTPPQEESTIRKLLDNLEQYINTNDGIDPLIKMAIIHYQFETIHPFLDGNGRIGRLIIPLFLKEKQLLTHPTLYISYFLKRNRIEYYDRMMEVRLKGNFEQWVQFFLKAVAESSQDAIQTIDLLLELHERDLTKVMESKKSLKSTVQVFEYVKRNPIIDIKKTSAEIGVVFNTVAKAVKNLMDIGILKQTENSRRNRCFAYDEYLGILRKDT